MRPVLVAQVTDLVDRLSTEDERRSDGVYLHLASKANVALVLLGHRRKPHDHVRHVHALAFAQRPAVGDSAVDVASFDMLDLKTDETVVDEDDRPRLHLLRQARVVKAEAFGGALDLVGRHDDGSSRLEHDLLVTGRHAGPDLRAFGVHHDRHAQVFLLGDASHALDVGAMVLVAAVAEVETSDIHTREHHRAQDLVILGGRSHGADNLCLLVGMHDRKGPFSAVLAVCD